jgi:hypothetical protein
MVCGAMRSFCEDVGIFLGGIFRHIPTRHLRRNRMAGALVSKMPNRNAENS